jgi:hypothetical protein
MLRSLFILTPVHLLAAIAYIAVVYTLGPQWFDRVVWSPVLPSDVIVPLRGETIMIVVTIGFLMIESIKSVLTGWASITNHVLSAILFVTAFGALITQPAFGTVAWIVVTWTMFADMMIGFVVTTMAARRDFDVR